MDPCVVLYCVRVVCIRLSGVCRVEGVWGCRVCA